MAGLGSITIAPRWTIVFWVTFVAFLWGQTNRLKTHNPFFKLMMPLLGMATTVKGNCLTQEVLTKMACMA